MTLTFKLDLDILPLDSHTKIQGCTFVRSPLRARHTDRQTDRQTDDAKTITPVADAGCNKIIAKVWCHETEKAPIPSHDEKYFASWGANCSDFFSLH